MGGYQENEAASLAMTVDALEDWRLEESELQENWSLQLLPDMEVGSQEMASEGGEEPEADGEADNTDGGANDGSSDDDAGGSNNTPNAGDPNTPGTSTLNGGGGKNLIEKFFDALMDLLRKIFGGSNSDNAVTAPDDMPTTDDQNPDSNDGDTEDPASSEGDGEGGGPESGDTEGGAADGGEADSGIPEEVADLFFDPIGPDAPINPQGADMDDTDQEAVGLI